MTRNVRRQGATPTHVIIDEIISYTTRSLSDAEWVALDDDEHGAEPTSNDLPMPGQVTRFTDQLGSYDPILEAEVTDPDDANLVTSEVEGKPGMHRPVLDIDLPVKAVESSTPGHFHLYIDHELTWEEYQRLIWVLADLGLVEQGFASTSDKRGYTAVRPPWVRK